MSTGDYIMIAVFLAYLYCCYLWVKGNADDHDKFKLN
jgi:hypothetical protein